MTFTLHRYHEPMTWLERRRQAFIRRQRVHACAAWIAHYTEEIGLILNDVDRDPADAPEALDRLHHAEERLRFWRERLADLRAEHKCALPHNHP